MTNNDLWQAVLGELELTISKPNFTTWFRNTYIVSFDDGAVVLGVPNAFTQSWLEKKYHQLVFKILNNLTGKSVKQVIYKVESRPSTTATTEPSLVVANEKPLNLEDFQFKTTGHQTNQTSVDRFGLNPRYTFESFVVGKGNELAHAAAQAVATKLGTVYNPLFVYGGVGLGKTHLLQAVGHQCLKNNKTYRVLYVTCEKFINDYIHDVHSGRAREFKDRYRTVDLLLIDDVQLIGGKDGSQEELFHTFNELHQNNRQIVLSSDRHPKNIPALEDRLKSRFQWGMMTDIGNPDFETRMAILDNKCKEKGVSIDKNVLNHVATVIQSNVRELEGAFNKLIAYCQFKNLPISLGVAKTILQSLEASSQRKNVSPKAILNTVANYFELKMEDLLGASREKRLAVPRQIVMFLLREELKSSYPTIGNEVGGRDHTTAMHAYSKIKQELDNDMRLKQDVENIKHKMYMV